VKGSRGIYSTVCEHVLHHFAIWKLQTHPAVLRGSKKITHAHESPFYHCVQFPYPFAIIYRRKKIKLDTFWTDLIDSHSWNFKNLNATTRQQMALPGGGRELTDPGYSVYVQNYLRHTLK
jgi:hypothetical protein